MRVLFQNEAVDIIWAYGGRDPRIGGVPAYHARSRGERRLSILNAIVDVGQEEASTDPSKDGTKNWTEADVCMPPICMPILSTPFLEGLSSSVWTTFRLQSTYFFSIVFFGYILHEFWPTLPERLSWPICLKMSSWSCTFRWNHFPKRFIWTRMGSGLKGLRCPLPSTLQG